MSKLQIPLLLLIVFLGPNQLAYHFWPNWSLVYGIRIDYLSIKIYLTEILILLSVLIYLATEGLKVKYRLKINHLFIIIYLAINLYFSIIPVASLIYLIRFTTLCLFVFIIKKMMLKKRFIFLLYNTIFFSLVFFGSIGIIQFLKGSTIQGMLYFLGERSFNTNSINVALTDVFGRLMLRSYSTFSHPNSMAGYFLLIWLLLAAIDLKPLLSKRYVIGNLVILISFLLTFSKSAIFSFVLILLIFVFVKFKQKYFNFFKYLPVVMISLSLCLMPLSNHVTIINSAHQKNLLERFELFKNTQEIVKNNILFGVGANNYIISLANLRNKTIWLLQPVHNSYLLVFAEFGITGIIFLYFILQKVMDKIVINKSLMIYPIFAVLLTGFADHYWLTLIQNQFALALFFAILLNIPNKTS